MNNSVDTEKIIVTLTSWKPRFSNIPVVLETIFNQTVKPDIVVLNIADEETVPHELQEYIDKRHIEVNRVPDTKVYKKLIPTLKKYPEACVISIDDDFLYPEGMIQDFMKIHQKYPSFPISGNRMTQYGMQCHCGCASLTKAMFLGKYLDEIDSDLMSNCASDDLVYTFLSNMAGFPYIRTNDEYFVNMESYNNIESYSPTSSNDQIVQTYNYLIMKFGGSKGRIANYATDDYWKTLMNDVELSEINHYRYEAYNCIRRTASYRIGNILLIPLSWIKTVFGYR